MTLYSTRAKPAKMGSAANFVNIYASNMRGQNGIRVSRGGRGHLVFLSHAESIRGNTVRMIVKPARQLSVADFAMRLNPFSFRPDRFAFRPD